MLVVVTPIFLTLHLKKKNHFLKSLNHHKTKLFTKNLGLGMTETLKKIEPQNDIYNRALTYIKEKTTFISNVGYFTHRYNTEESHETTKCMLDQMYTLVALVEG